MVVLGKKRDVSQGRVGYPPRIEEVADIVDIGADYAGFYVKTKRLGIIERSIHVLASADQVSTQPADVDAEVWTFSQHQVMSIDSGRSRIGRGGNCRASR